LSDQTCWCGTKTDSYVCRACTRDMAAQIASIPALLRDLEVTISRQDHLDGAGAALMSVRSSRVWQESDDPTVDDVPAELRGRSGRITLPATPWPMSWNAADLAWTVRNTLYRWARHIARVEGLDVDLGLRQGPVCRGCTHPSCRSVSMARATTPDQWVAMFLLRTAESIRFNIDGPEIAGDVQFLIDALQKARDRRAPECFAGRCDAPDVRVDIVAGTTISPHVAACGAEMFYRFEDTEVKCPACGAVYDVVERKAFLVESMAEEWARPKVIANSLSSLDLGVTAATIDLWVHRAKARREKNKPLEPGDFFQLGIDDDGKPLYRVGDVIVRVEIARQTAKLRQAEKAVNKTARGRISA
jgi:hypothetical protein